MVLTSAKPVAAKAAPKKRDPYRVMIVDDSAVIRGMMTRWLEEDPKITVVSTARNGKDAIDIVKKDNPEIVLLDIEMPVMDGITALPKIIAAAPDVRVIMSSTLTVRGAEISMKALAKGAADYVPKPESKSDINASQTFKKEVIQKIKALASATRAKGPKRSFSADRTARPASAINRGGTVTLRKASDVKPTLLAIGSSTGGPQALFEFLKGLSPDFALPIVITQHMPATFTSILADHITKSANRPCAEGKQGDVLASGHIYVAPGDYHMTVKRQGTSLTLNLDQNPQENFCRPAVDPLFLSVAKTIGASALCVVLTGMGHDGMKGGGEIVEAGGTILAQDEKSSVVWGMPGAVATAGLCSAVLPVSGLSKAVMTLVEGGKL